MTKFLLDVTHLDSNAKRSSVQRMVERDWPGVPREGELVSLGGGDRVLAPLADAQWQDGWVRLVFLLRDNEEDQISLQELVDLGFAPMVVPDEPPALT